MTNAGTRAALSGYRLQALYTANLLFHESAESRMFQPEGKEDVAIYQRGELERVVQVKAYSAPLTLSDLEPEKPASFFRRVLRLEEDDAAVELVSFGPLGPELLRLKEGDQDTLATIAQKLHGYGYSLVEADTVLQRLTITTEDEAAISHSVFEALTRTVTVGDPDRAFELLVWWLLDAAERRLQITRQRFRDRLQAVGRYLFERRAHHQEWFTTIKPLEDQPDLRSVDDSILEREYYRGAAARYSHIRADLDVRRESLLDEIHAKFEQGERIVILHGASGQGKTSLALRFLHDYVPDGWRFLVTTIDSRRHAATIANAFADHLYALDLPLYVLVDVAPRDRDWATLVREVLDYQQVRILIAIREEDLARQTATAHELGFPADVRLEFNPSEAEPIYETLVRRTDALNAFPTFREAWERFGGEGPLLEFVFLLTQTASLRSVLTAQVQRLREEVRAGILQPNALRFLHLCAIATAYEARVMLRPLITHLELSDPTGTLRIFEEEYLLRAASNATAVEGLHPVRSAVLVEVLADPAFAPTDEVALEVLPFVAEDDLEIFLLYLLSRHSECWDHLQTYLLQFNPSSWSLAVGVGRAMLWWGLRCYLIENAEPLGGYRRLLAGPSNLMFILPDLGGACETDPIEAVLELLEDQNETACQQLRALRAVLTPTERAFEPLRGWLQRLRIRATPSASQEWESAAELIFWASHLGVELAGLPKLNEVPFEGLSIEVVAKVCLALASADPAQYSSSLVDHQERLKDRFREQTLTPFLEEGAEDITAHFVVKYDYLYTNERGGRLEEVEMQRAGGASAGEQADPEADGHDLSERLNQEAVSRASLLRALFPEKSLFCTQGYGHQLGIEGTEMPYDGTSKRMPARSILVPWLTRTNSICNSLWLYEARPETWREYAGTILGGREQLATTLLRLQRSLSRYFKGDRPRNILSGPLQEGAWQEAKVAANSDPPLPMSAVDEWGLSSETQRLPNGDQPSRSAKLASVASLLSQRPLSSALRDYFMALSNFFSKAELVCVTHGFFGRPSEARGRIRALAEEAGYDQHTVRVAKFNLFSAMEAMPAMQAAFDERAGLLVDAEQLARVKRRESRLFPQLWAMWYQFSDHPDEHFVDARIQAMSLFKNARSNLISALEEAIPSDDEWRAILLSDDCSWEGKGALVLQLDVDRVELLQEAKERLFDVLEETIGRLEAASLAAFVRDYYWSYVLVVPCTRGRLLDGTTWVLPVTSLAGLWEEPLVERGWLKILHPVSSKQVQKLGLLKTQPTDVDLLIIELRGVAAQLQILFAHLDSFSSLATQLDSNGRAILSAYTAEVTPQINEFLLSFDSLSVKVSQELRSCSLLERELTEEVVSTLDGTLADLRRFAEEDRPMTFEECRTWAVTFEEVGQVLLGFSWLSVQEQE